MLALLLLAGGAAMNVAVAWGCGLSARMTIPDPPGYAMSTSGAETIVFGGDEFWLRFNQPDFTRQYDLVCWEWRGTGTRMLRVSPWVNHYTLPEDTGHHLIERKSGWPLRSMHGECRRVNEMYWAIPVPESWGRRYNFMALTATPIAGAFLPLKPLWPGFLINTLFYALILWPLVFAPFTARRILRRRRGRCAKCAYPVGVSSVCTECGATVSPKVRRSHTAP